MRAFDVVGSRKKYTRPGYTQLPTRALPCGFPAFCPGVSRRHAGGDLRVLRHQRDAGYQDARHVPAQEERDLFDLYWALTALSAMPVEVDSVIGTFYMQEGETVSGEELLGHMRRCLADKKGYCQDMVAAAQTQRDLRPHSGGHVVARRWRVCLNRP